MYGKLRYNSTILNFGTGWTWVGPKPGLDDGEEKNLLPLPGNQPWIFGHPACSLVTILIVLTQLLMFGTICNFIQERKFNLHIIKEQQ
jgi:hypothetical protein